MWTALGQWTSLQRDFSKVQSQAFLKLFNPFKNCFLKSIPGRLCLDELGDEERGEPCIKQVYFRQFLPVSPKVYLDFISFLSQNLLFLGVFFFFFDFLPLKSHQAYMWQKYQQNPKVANNQSVEKIIRAVWSPNIKPFLYMGFICTHCSTVVTWFLIVTMLFLNLLNLMLLQVQFDLVTAAYTLSELPHVKDREDAVLTLWRKTKSYLVCLGVWMCLRLCLCLMFSLFLNLGVGGKWDQRGASNTYGSQRNFIKGINCWWKDVSKVHYFYCNTSINICF